MNLWELLIIAIALACYVDLIFKLRHDLHMLQQNSYRNERYRRWYKSHRHQEIWIPFKRHAAAKKPLVWTARVKRLYLTALILAALLLPLIYLSPWPLLALLALTACSGHYLLLVNSLLKPIEAAINRRYLNEAKQILAARPNLKRVAITGSYGKTSCKMILNAMLSEEFTTLATPESVNTPMGITRVIREQLKPIHEVFICEMGARQSGDIAELCDLVQPQVGLLTAIGPQHLETFGSQEAIVETKFELIRALPPHGTATLNLDNQLIAANQDQSPCVISGYGLLPQHPYHAEDICYNAQGLRFTLVAPQGERQQISSRLLGRHNVCNIVGAAAAAHALGLPLALAARAMRSLDPLPHRLQLLSGRDYTIIDDAFNSNPEGASAALEVLAQMEGGRKILVTPGMVELGSAQQELNRAFAKEAAQVCDYIVLVGKKHSLPLQEGLAQAGYPKDCYTVAADLNEARAILTQQVRPGDTVLFENDLPDTYNE